MLSELHKLTPMTLLLELESRSRHHAMGLPMQLEIRNTWTGIAFRIDNTRLVSEMNSVDEILSIPPYTRVPGSQAWVKGLANVRGTLMPIIDLRILLNAGKTKQERHTRMLVVKSDGAVAGLMVDEVYGMRHFFVTDKIDKMPDTEVYLEDYILGCYQHDDLNWGLFDMNRISSSSAFHQVAALSA